MSNKTTLCYCLNMYLITVLPLSKKARTDVLSYFHANNIPAGTLVEVPFRKGTLRALVTDTKPIEDVKGAIKEASFQLKKITKVLPDNPVSGALFDTCKELSEFYLSPLSKIIDDIVPEALFEENLSGFDETLPGLLSESLLLAGGYAERMSWYKTRIRELFAQKKSIFFALPTDHEARAFHTTLSRGIEEYAILITGAMTKKKQSTALSKIQNESHALCVVGTGTYASIPRADLHTIVIEHESSANYRRLTAPHIDMRLFIELLGKKKKNTVILADTLPRVETYSRYESHELSEVLPFTFHPDAPSNESLIKREHQTERGTFLMLSTELCTEIERVIQSGSQIFLFTLRTGLASITACRDCGEIVSCEYCQAPLSLYTTQNKRLFICKTCKRHTPSDSACTRCGSWNLYPFGIGAESVYEECVKLFPNTPIMRIDRTHVKSDAEAQAIAHKFQSTPGSILIGTELALHYIEDKIPSIGVTSFDSLFSIPSFRVSERIVELITVLREKTQKNLIIQTMYPDDRLLAITSKSHLFEWYREELAERTEFDYPPKSTLIKIIAHINRTELDTVRNHLSETLRQWSPEIYTGSSSERKNFTKVIALVRVPQKEWWFPTLGKGNILNVDLKKTLLLLEQKYSILVNPEDLL